MAYTNPINKDYKSPTPGAITILAWSPATDDQGLTDDYCKVMAECGFNSTQVTVTITKVSNTLTNCEKYGIYPFMGHIHLSRSEAECKSYLTLTRTILILVDGSSQARQYWVNYHLQEI